MAGETSLASIQAIRPESQFQDSQFLPIEALESDRAGNQFDGFDNQPGNANQGKRKTPFEVELTRF